MNKRKKAILAFAVSFCLGSIFTNKMHDNKNAQEINDIVPNSLNEQIYDEIDDDEEKLFYKRLCNEEKALSYLPEPENGLYTNISKYNYKTSKCYYKSIFLSCINYAKIIDLYLQLHPTFTYEFKDLKISEPMYSDNQDETPTYTIQVDKSNMHLHSLYLDGKSKKNFKLKYFRNKKQLIESENNNYIDKYIFNKSIDMLGQITPDDIEILFDESEYKAKKEILTNENFLDDNIESIFDNYNLNTNTFELKVNYTGDYDFKNDLKNPEDNTEIEILDSLEENTEIEILDSSE